MHIQFSRSRSGFCLTDELSFMAEYLPNFVKPEPTLSSSKDRPGDWNPEPPIFSGIRIVRRLVFVTSSNAIGATGAVVALPSVPLMCASYTDVNKGHRCEVHMTHCCMKISHLSDFSWQRHVQTASELPCNPFIRQLQSQQGLKHPRCV